MGDAREALEQYAEERAALAAFVQLRRSHAPRAFDALQEVLEYADSLERLAYDKWMAPYPTNATSAGHYVGVMETQRETADGIRARIAEALENKQATPSTSETGR